MNIFCFSTWQFHSYKSRLFNRPGQADGYDHPSADFKDQIPVWGTIGNQTLTSFRKWFFYVHARNTPEADEIFGF